MPSAFLSYAKSARSSVEVLGEDMRGLGYDSCQAPLWTR